MIRMLAVKGEGLSADEMSLATTEMIRVSLGNSETAQSMGVSMVPDGTITISVVRDLRTTTVSPELLFSGTIDELIARLA